MKGTILLNHNDNTKQVEEEERNRFLRGVLEQTGIPGLEFWDSDTLLSVEQRIQLRGVLTRFGIQVIDDLDGHMKVYFEGQLVAEWMKPQYKLKRDLQQLDRRKQIYLEMEVNCWSLFDEMSEQQSPEQS